LLFNFPLEYAINSVQLNKENLKLNGTHYFCLCWWCYFIAWKGT